MKSILQIILFCLTMPCLAQPTGHQKIFLEITDGVDTLNFKGCFKLHKYGSKANLNYKKYQLLDVSKNPSGFEYYPDRGYIHKTLMTDDHEIVIVKNNTDTMRIQLFNSFNVYFLSIPFQKGSFRMIVNDGHENKWAVNTLPYKKLNNEQIVYDLTPTDWSPFRMSKGIVSPNYSVETQFRKQGLLAEPVLPENDPNFKNPRRMNNLRLEVADYNFDGQKDYREQKWNNTKEWNYFIYKNSETGFVLDTLLSSLDDCHFDFEKKTFIGSKTIRIDSLSTQIHVYEYIDRIVTLVQQRLCVKAFPNSEKTDCFIRVLENGKWVDKKPILGAE